MIPNPFPFFSLENQRKSVAGGLFSPPFFSFVPGPTSEPCVVSIPFLLPHFRLPYREG